LKLKVLERLRFACRYNANSAPARALMIGDRQAIVAHAFAPETTLTVWTKQPGQAAVALERFNGSAVSVRLQSGDTLIGLSTSSASSEADWLALGEINSV
jgi:hypothetical protein